MPCLVLLTVDPVDVIHGERGGVFGLLRRCPRPTFSRGVPADEQRAVAEVLLPKARRALRARTATRGAASRPTRSGIAGTSATSGGSTGGCGSSSRPGSRTPSSSWPRRLRKLRSSEPVT